MISCDAFVMEHFPIVLALVRAAARDRNPVVIQHAERLREALAEQGSAEEVKALDHIFDGLKKAAGKLTPARVVQSRAVSHGETITPNTAPPVDKETSSPLAEIWPIERLADLVPPILDERLDRAVQHLVSQWRGAERLQSAGVRVPRSVLLFGPPGTGKTRLAFWMAQNLGLPVVLARLDGLTSSFLGTTARNVRSLFDFANRHRCMLLLDEFDGIAKLRDDPQELGEVKRVVNAVLQAMDTRAPVGLTLALTNHENLLDPAVWRRFDARVQIGLPSGVARQKIIERYLGDYAGTTGSVKVLAWLTDGLSGSEVETMCDFIKRHLVLHADENASILEALDLFLDLSASNAISASREAFSKGPSVWIPEALANRELKIRQADIAELMDSTQSKISRLIRSADRV